MVHATWRTPRTRRYCPTYRPYNCPNLMCPGYSMTPGSGVYSISQWRYSHLTRSRRLSAIDSLRSHTPRGSEATLEERARTATAPSARRAPFSGPTPAMRTRTNCSRSPKRMPAPGKRRCGTRMREQLWHRCDPAWMRLPTTKSNWPGSSRSLATRIALPRRSSRCRQQPPCSGHGRGYASTQPGHRSEPTPGSSGSSRIRRAPSGRWREGASHLRASPTFQSTSDIRPAMPRPCLEVHFKMYRRETYGSDTLQDVEAGDEIAPHSLGVSAPTGEPRCDARTGRHTGGDDGARTARAPRGTDSYSEPSARLLEDHR